MNGELTYNSTLPKGKYKIYLKSAVIPEDWITSIIQTFKDLLGWGIEVLEGESVIINSAYVEEKEGEKFVVIEFENPNNSPTVGAVVIVFLAVLGVFGAFLTFSSIEQILDNPVIGTGVGLGVILLVIVAGYFFYKNFLTGT